MTTFAQMKESILRCAAAAQADEPNNRDDRARCFVAKLSGSMAALKEPALEKAIWALLSDAPPPKLWTPTKGPSCAS